MKAIIIGAGLAGLTIGCELVKKGHAVTVYEQNPFIGGVMHHAKKNGYEWEQGPLMLTSFEGGGACRRILNDLGVTYDVMFCDRGSVFPDFALWKPVKYAGPYWRKEELLKRFPDEKKGLDAYYSFYNRMLTLYDIQDKLEEKKSLWYSLRLFLAFLSIKKYASMSAEELMDRFFTNNRLKTVFTAILADLCMKPGELSALAIPSLNIETAFDKRIYTKRGKLTDPHFTYILGGTERITEQLGTVIQENNGKIVTGTTVEKVIVENGRAVGVRLSDGKTDTADVVIASGGAKELFFRLVGRQYMSDEYIKTVSEILPMEAVFMVHIGLDFDPMQYQKSELCYYYLTYNIDSAVDTMRKGIYHEGKQGFLIYVDSAHGDNMAPKGKYAVTIYTVAPDTLIGADWEDKKERYADTLLELAENYMPGLRSHITEKLILAAPDYRKLMHVDRVSFGGLVPLIGHIRPSHITPIKNLFFIGAQSESGGGVNTQIRAMHKLFKNVISKTNTVKR
jgi:phytoene dehydrogenase-like protein